ALILYFFWISGVIIICSFGLARMVCSVNSRVMVVGFEFNASCRGSEFIRRGGIVSLGPPVGDVCFAHANMMAMRPIVNMEEQNLCMLKDIYQAGVFTCAFSSLI